MLMPELATAVSGLLCWAIALDAWSATMSHTTSARRTSIPASSSHVARRVGPADVEAGVGLEARRESEVVHDHAEVQDLVVDVDRVDSSEQHRESVAPLAVGDDVRRARLRDQSMGRDRERGLGRNDRPVPGRRHVVSCTRRASSAIRDARGDQ